MLIELNFHKTAEDIRPEAGFWGKTMAAHRATRKDGKWWMADDEARAINRKHLAISALVGALPGYGIYKFNRGMYGGNRGLDAVVATLVGLNTGGLVGTAALKKPITDYYANRGIDYNVWTGVKDMTDDAKMKYLSKKYRGGGYA